MLAPTLAKATNSSSKGHHATESVDARGLTTACIARNVGNTELAEVHGHYVVECRGAHVRVILPIIAGEVARR